MLCPCTELTGELVEKRRIGTHLEAHNWHPRKTRSTNGIRIPTSSARARRLWRGCSPSLSPGADLAVGLGVAFWGAVRVGVLHDDRGHLRDTGRLSDQRGAEPGGQSQFDLVHRVVQ